MATFIYRCPKTGFKVQGWLADETTDASTFVSVNCLACNGIHLVNPATGAIPSEVKSPDK
jgi:hypothetical protein